MSKDTLTLKSFADLPKIISAGAAAPVAQKRQARTHSWTQPIYIQKLLDHCGGIYAKAGAILGVSGGTLNKALKTGKAVQVVEEAARGYYEREIERKTPPPRAHLRHDGQGSVHGADRQRQLCADQAVAGAGRGHHQDVLGLRG